MIWGKRPPWEKTKYLWVKETGTWKECYRAWVKSGGIWQLIHGPWPYYGPTTGNSVLLHCDGTSGSTVFVDSGKYGLTVVNSGFPSFDIAYVDTDTKKFGTGSFNGITSGYLTIQDTRIAPVGTNDFTIDAWINIPTPSLNSYFMIADMHCVGSPYRNQRFSFFYVGGDPSYLSGIGNWYGTEGVYFPWNPNGDTWYHVAQVRYNGTVTIYVNGVALGSAYWPDDLIAYENVLFIGTAFNYSQFAIGYIDEFRFINGEAAWHSDFTPPSGPYT